MEPGRRLTVMADPGVGAFGLAVGGTVLLVRWAALSTLRPGILLVAGLWCLSRTVMAVIGRTLPYVRGDRGLAGAFQAPSSQAPSLRRGGNGWHRAWLGGGLVLGGVLLAAWRVGPGLASGAAALVTAAAVAVLARRQIGGFTGDVLGASGVLAETAGLLVAAARW